MVGFVTTSYLLAAFLLLMGGAFFWFGLQAPKKFGLFPLRLTLFVNVLLYAGLAHFAVFGAVGYAVEETVTAPCEFVVNQSDEVNSTTVTYTYQDSCVGQTAPPIVLATMQVYNFAVQLMFLQVILFIMAWAWKGWGERW